jgi:hypothetical protein
MPTLKVAIATACGNKKREGEWPAHDLYLSPRIKAVYRRRGDLPFYILSAQHGLIDCDDIIRSYERVMDWQRARAIAPQAASVLQNYDWFVFFKAGARQEYVDCVKLAAGMSNVSVISVGYGFMGGLQDFLSVARELEAGQLPSKDIRSLEVHLRK